MFPLVYSMGHVALRIHVFNFGLAERKDCCLRGGKKEDSIHILCPCTHEIQILKSHVSRTQRSAKREDKRSI